MPTPGYTQATPDLPIKWANMLNLLPDYRQYGSMTDLLATHMVLDDIKHGQLIAQGERATGFVLLNQNACANVSTNLYSQSLQTKQWAPVEATGRVDYCYTEFQADPWFGQFKPTAQNIADLLTMPEFRQYFEMKNTMNVLKDVYMQAWFSSTSNTAVGSGSGTQTVTSADMVPYLNTNSGFWEQIAAGISAGDSKYTAIAANNEATKALQNSTFTGALAFEALVNCVTEANAIQQGQTDNVILVTQSVYNKLLAYALTKQQESGFHRMDFGNVERWAIDNKPIVPMPVWDQVIRANFDNGTKWDRPHRICMTSAKNLGIGLEDANVIFADFFYDRRDKKVYSDFGGRMDFVLLDAVTVSAAY